MIIPIFNVRDMAEAIGFLTDVLDFRLAFAWPEDAPFHAGVVRGTDELHLSLASGPRPRGHGSAVVVCDGVDVLFAAFKGRGLTPPIRPESPVHEGPLDQTWGTREVYIDDPSGNTLIYQQR